MCHSNAIIHLDMTEKEPQAAQKPQKPRWAYHMVVWGLAAAILASGGLLVLWTTGEDAPISANATALEAITRTPQASPTRGWQPDLSATQVPADSAMLDREILPIPSNTPDPTPTPTVTPPVIRWTQAEKNALSWMCYGEVGGMAEAKVDACLSVISTVRARYAYFNNFGETDVLSTLLRPGQFAISIRSDIPSPDPDINWAVEIYMNGTRGSCTGFLYFNSAPGGPSLCMIRSSNGQWVEFHNGW